MSLQQRLNRLARYPRLSLIYSSWRRLWRWEFMPMWLFYPPIVLWIIGLTLKYRCLAFTTTNPALPVSGLFGEQKSHLLKQLQDKDTQYVARFAVLSIQQTLIQRRHVASMFMQENQLNFPIVIKPENGQRGSDVTIIQNDQQLDTVLQVQQSDCLVQEYVAGLEFGVFFVLQKQSQQLEDTEQAEHGFIFSLTEKCFPTIVGDGASTIQQLILRHPRGHLSAKLFLNQHALHKNTVLPDQEVMKLVELGTHSRGSLFVDSMHDYTLALERTFCHIANQLDGFNFGRFDIRVPDRHSLHKGQQIKVLEVNGVTSEATHMYDPRYPLGYAYRVMFRQWKLAFEVGLTNIKQGQNPLSFFDFLKYVKSKYGL